ncbi:MAG: hypothetical protein WD690_08215 [Vicinamibacterales bacterium]
METLKAMRRSRRATISAMKPRSMAYSSSAPARWIPAAASPFSHCVPSLWQYTATRAAAFDALCSRAASGVPMSIQVVIFPVRSRIEIIGSSGSDTPRENSMLSRYSTRYASTRATRYSSDSEGCCATRSASDS